MSDTNTTIQLDTQTKHELFQLKNKIELELGRPISYNELILILIAEKKKHISRSPKNHLIRELRGILPTTTPNDYYQAKIRENHGENHE